MQVHSGADAAHDPAAAAPRPGTLGEGAPVLLRVEDLIRRFGGVAAVAGVSFDLGRGEILGVIGPNGAGKTTLFDCLAGSLRPNSGRILLSGRRIEGLPAHARLRAGLGRTFQIPRPFPQMTLIENVVLGRQDLDGERILPNWLAPGRVARQEKEARERAMELLDFVTLAPLAHKPAAILSGGQRKLLELARVMMADPAMVLLDEPAAGVNPALLDLIIERIVAINRRGTTFLLIEHNMDMVARLCGRVLVMASGRLLAEGTPDEVSRDPEVIEAYLGGAPA